MPSRRVQLLNFYDALMTALGPSHWWPGETPFEVTVGAILTQNTNWTNVERAIVNLKAAGLMDPAALYAVPEAHLAELIRPAGYYRLKAARLRNFLRFLRRECGFDFSALAERETSDLREALLAVKGVGQETADSILLYALNKPVFVVDAYTRRLCNRHGLVAEEADYREVQELFMDCLEEDVNLFNEYHALIVRTAKEWCRKTRPRCSECPLEPFL
ncbi:MAG: endonuclease III domain-containing protein [Desulfovibrionaceae bacterium]|jgi:endonuclease-3 related protein|nr:endonuclease III domain-containing protein [Desulfovibrionaceae bacterium]